MGPELLTPLLIGALGGAGGAAISSLASGGTPTPQTPQAPQAQQQPVGQKPKGGSQPTSFMSGARASGASPGMATGTTGKSLLGQ